MWHSVKQEGLPPEREIVLVTVIYFNGERGVYENARYIRDLKSEGYKDEFCAEHPDGIWEWLYEAGAGYWEHLDNTVVAWAYSPEPYMGD